MSRAISAFAVPGMYSRMYVGLHVYTDLAVPFRSGSDRGRRQVVVRRFTEDDRSGVGRQESDLERLDRVAGRATSCCMAAPRVSRPRPRLVARTAELPAGVRRPHVPRRADVVTAAARPPTAAAAAVVVGGQSRRR